MGDLELCARALTGERGHGHAKLSGLIRVSTLNFKLSTQPTAQNIPDRLAVDADTLVSHLKWCYSGFVERFAGV